MIVKIYSYENEFDQWRHGYAIKVNETLFVDIMEGEPEDAILYRDFSDVKKIPDLMKLAYEAGKKR